MSLKATNFTKETANDRRLKNYKQTSQRTLFPIFYRDVGTVQLLWYEIYSYTLHG